MCSLFNMIAGAASGVYQGTIQNAQNNAKYTVQMAQTDAANLLSQDQADNNNAIRLAGNSFAAAQASLINTQRSISNQQKANAIGSQYNAHQETMARTLESTVRGSVEQQIQGASALGAMRADAAARGTGGSASEIMRSTMKQTVARQQVYSANRTAEITFDGVMQAAGLRSNLITSQDYGTSVANMNYQAAIPTTTIAPMKMPDLSMAQMELMGAAGGGGFQAFSQSNNAPTAVGGTNGGGVGNTPNYSSNAILNGIDKIADAARRGDTYSGAGSVGGFTLDSTDSESTSYGHTSGGNSFNFTLD